MRVIGALFLTAILIVTLSGCGTAANDAAITAKIKAEYAKDETINATAIDVDAANGVVTLKGAVPSAKAKARATEIARTTGGVTRVVDNIEVRREMAAEGTADRIVEGAATAARTAADLGIAASVKTALGVSRDVKAGDIRVDAHGGVVTLSAEPGKKPDLKRAAEVARKVPGVKTVEVK